MKEFHIIQYNKFLITLHLIKKPMTTVHPQTLYHIIDSIKLKKFTLNRSRTPSTDQEDQITNKYWTLDQQHIFFNIFLMYGADYSILQHHFPGKSRKQIKKKCQQIQFRRKRSILRAEQKVSKDKRKDFFDEEVMQFDMIKWRNSKPNKPESLSQSEQN